MSQLSMTAQRMEGVDFAMPYFYDPLTYILNNAFAYASNGNPLFDENLLKISLITLIALAITGIVACILSRITKEVFSIAWSEFRAFMSKGIESEEFPTNRTLSTMVMVWTLFGFFILAILGGVLVATLSPTPPNPVDTLKELDEMKIKPVFTKDSWNIPILEVSSFA